MNGTPRYIALTQVQAAASSGAPIVPARETSQNAAVAVIAPNARLTREARSRTTVPVPRRRIARPVRRGGRARGCPGNRAPTNTVAITLRPPEIPAGRPAARIAAEGEAPGAGPIEPGRRAPPTLPLRRVTFDVPSILTAGARLGYEAAHTPPSAEG